MYEYCTGLFVYKSLHYKLPTIFCDIYFRNVNVRNSLNLKSIYCNNKICQQAIYVNGVKVWNSFPEHVKSISTMNKFKYDLKN